MGVLLKAIIDETRPLSDESQRFASILQFVADDCDTGIFYLFEDWTVRAAVGESTLDFHPERPRIVYLSKNDYAIGKSWEKQDGTLAVHIPKDELVFSPSGTVCKGALEQQGLNATTALLTLAAAGVDIALPSFFLRRSDDEIKAIREKLEEDRVIYLGAISQMAIQAFDRLSSREFTDIYRWAREEAVMKILPKARRLEMQIRKLDRSLLERAGVQFWRDGVPAIGKALIQSGKDGLIRAVGEEAVRVFATSLARRIEERQVPEATYAVKLSVELSKI
jgi:hypothetical protein